MPASRAPRRPARPGRTAPRRPETSARTAADRAAIDAEVRTVLAWLQRTGTRRNRDGMARYGIVAAKVAGVSVAALRQRATRIGRRHDLAEALWDAGWHETRLLAALVDDPGRVTPAQMDRWCRDFDNWAVCDTVCFHLFDKTPHAWRKVDAWSRRRGEFQKRAAFALLASIARHDRSAADDLFLARLPLIEQAAADDRNFVRKGVSWALRSIGHRTPLLHQEALALARRLADAPDAPARWIGRDALRDLSRTPFRVPV